MKCLILICLLFICTGQTLAQSHADSLMPKLNDVDCKKRIYNLTQANKKMEYDLYFLQNYKRTVTIHKSKDSLLLKYLSFENKTIRQEENHYFFGEKSDSIIRFYNKEGLLEYSEFWTCSLLAHDTNGDGTSKMIKIEPFLATQTRLAYDSNGRYVLGVLLSPYAQSRTKYFYDTTGNLIESKSEEIKQYEFWDK